MMNTPQPTPPIIRLKKVIAVNDNSPQAVNDYERGRTEGWNANNEYRRDERDMLQAVNSPNKLFLLGILLTVYGVMFALANLANAYRWHFFDFWLIAFAVVPLTGAFFIFRGLPKARLKAKQAQERFNSKWNKR
jgi:hypothetical protein